MFRKIVLATLALATVTSAASATGLDFAYSSRDRELAAQSARVVPNGPVYVTPINPSLDPAYDSRDLELQAASDRLAASGATSAIATNDSNLVTARPSAFDPAYDSEDRRQAEQLRRAFGN